MSKKKREHVVFDNMRKIKKSIDFNKVNTEMNKSRATRIVLIAQKKAVHKPYTEFLRDADVMPNCYYNHDFPELKE